MRLCLIPSLDFLSLSSSRLELAEAYLPLGVMCLLGALERDGRTETVVVDLNLEIETGRLGVDASLYESAAHIIASNHSDVYGFSTTCGDYLYAVRIAEKLKHLRPDATVLFGGPHASITAKRTLQAFPCVDIVICGEADETICELAEAMNNDSGLRGVDGITYRSYEGSVIETPSRRLPDLDTLAIPAYHHYAFLFQDSNDFIPLDIGRGCPFECTFCSTNDFFGRRFRLKSTDRIVAEIEHLHTNYRVSSFLFPHDMFTTNRPKVVEVCQALSDLPFQIRWNCSARVDCVDQELMQMMSDAGCVAIHYGVESGSAALQKVIKKRLKVDRVEASVELALKVGMRPKNSFIVGFPEETEEDLRATMQLFLKTLNGGKCTNHLGVLATLPGTELFNNHFKKLKYDGFFTSDFVSPNLLDAEAKQTILENPELFSAYCYIPNPSITRGLIKFLCVIKVLALHTPKFLVAVSHELDLIDELYPMWSDWCQAENREFSVRWYTRHDQVLAGFVEFATTCLALRKMQRMFLLDLLAYEYGLFEMSGEILDFRYRELRACRLGLSDSTDDAGPPNAVQIRLSYDMCELVKDLEANPACSVARVSPTIHIVSAGNEAEVEVLALPDIVRR